MPQRPRMRQVLLTDRPAHRHILPSPLARRMACARQPPPSTQPFCRDAAAGVKHSPPARDKPPFTGQVCFRERPTVPISKAAAAGKAEATSLGAPGVPCHRGDVRAVQGPGLGQKTARGTGAGGVAQHRAVPPSPRRSREPRLPPETQTQRRRLGCRGSQRAWGLTPPRGGRCPPRRPHAPRPPQCRPLRKSLTLPGILAFCPSRVCRSFACCDRAPGFILVTEFWGIHRECPTPFVAFRDCRVFFQGTPPTP